MKSTFTSPARIVDDAKKSHETLIDKLALGGGRRSCGEAMFAMERRFACAHEMLSLLGEKLSDWPVHH